MVGHRGVNNGVYSAERGFEGTDPAQWWALEPKVLSRHIHGKTHLSDEHIYSTEVQIQLFAMPFETSDEVIRCLCYVLGAKPGKEFCTVLLLTIPCELFFFGHPS